MIEQILLGLMVLICVVCVLGIVFSVRYACAKQQHTDYEWREAINPHKGRISE